MQPNTRVAFGAVAIGLVAGWLLRDALSTSPRARTLAGTRSAPAIKVPPSPDAGHGGFAFGDRPKGGPVPITPLVLEPLYRAPIPVQPMVMQVPRMEYITPPAMLPPVFLPRDLPAPIFPAVVPPLSPGYATPAPQTVPFPRPHALQPTGDPSEAKGISAAPRMATGNQTAQVADEREELEQARRKFDQFARELRELEVKARREPDDRVDRPAAADIREEVAAERKRLEQARERLEQLKGELRELELRAQKAGTRR